MDWSDYEVDGQLSIFDLTMEEFKITKPIRLIELFAGVGSQAMALRELSADFEHYRVVEFDKYAIASYNAIHGTDFPTMDITQISGSDLGIVETDKYCYIMTYSFPCQDLSVAGKQAGMTKGSGTRSGLLWEVERLLNEVDNLPKVLLMENVPQVHGKQATSQGYIECEVGGVADLSFPESKTRRGRVQENGQVSPTLMSGEQNICRIENVYDFYNNNLKSDGVCGTLTSACSHNGSGTFGVIEPQYRIRKLTPLECWRLMDFTDEDFEKAAEVNSNTQLYKQAGNSIVKNVLVAILGQMIPGKEDVYKKE